MSCYSAASPRWQVCLYNQICSNGADLFDLDAGEAFRCDFSELRFGELRELLLQPAQEPPGAKECHHAN